MSSAPFSVAVVGAGMAGLAAARFLTEAGHQVTVVDKGRSVGGRLATRRIGDATLDHGAQFFTVRDPEFAREIDAAQQAGQVFEWCRGFSGRADGHPRYVASGGMNRLAKYFAEGLPSMLGTEIESASTRDGHWLLGHAEGAIKVDAVVLTAPVPQSLALLDAAAAVLDPTVRSRLDDIAYHPTLAVLARLDTPSAVPAPGGVQLDDGPFSFVADNQAKGISDSPSLTLHVRHDLSAELWDNDTSKVLPDLLEQGTRWLGKARVRDAQLKRWRYAQPVTAAEHRYEATTIGGSPVVFAGDAFAGAKVEGAFLSGLAAARHLHQA